MCDKALLRRLETKSRHSHGFWSNIANLQAELFDFAKLTSDSCPESEGALS